MSSWVLSPQSIQLSSTAASASPVPRAVVVALAAAEVSRWNSAVSISARLAHLEQNHPDRSEWTMLSYPLGSCSKYPGLMNFDMLWLISIRCS
jgi:hypothetical protein